MFIIRFCDLQVISSYLSVYTTKQYIKLFPNNWQGIFVKTLYQRYSFKPTLHVANKHENNISTCTGIHTVKYHLNEPGSLSKKLSKSGGEFFLLVFIFRMSFSRHSANTLIGRVFQLVGIVFMVFYGTCRSCICFCNKEIHV